MDPDAAGGATYRSARFPSARDRSWRALATDRAATADPPICGMSRLCDRLLPRHFDRDLVEADRVVEDQLVECRLPERRLRRSMTHRPGIRPRAVETREIAGPQKIAQTDLGHAPKPAFFLDLEGEEDLAFDKLGRFLGECHIGLEDAGRRSAEIVFAVEAPEQERD